jgi:DNA-directed RNA polymerase specialized sigma24 family protein
METIIIDNQIILNNLLNTEKRQQALVQLLGKYQQRIYFFIRRLVLSHEDTDELVQDVFVHFYHHAPGLNLNDDLKQVLYGIAAEACQGYFRSAPQGEWLPGLTLLLKQEDFSFRDIAGMLNLPVSDVKAAFNGLLNKNNQ